MNFGNSFSAPRVCLLAVSLTLFSVDLSSRCLGQTTAPQVPPLNGEAGEGLVVDNYDVGLFSGAFKDEKTIFNLSVQPHANSKNGNFLWGDFDIAANGNAGFWNIPGRAWGTKQDWSQGKTLTFWAWSNTPLALRFTFKGDAERKYNARAKLSGAGVWEKITIPTRDWNNIAAGLGVVDGFDIHLEATGKGQFALDELRLEGAQETTQFGQKVELDPKVVFAKSLVPPQERSNKTYFVNAQTGDDSNDGSEAKPFKTIQKAANLVLPGDVVEVADGTYDENGEPGKTGLLISRSGAPDAWITFRAARGARPLIKTSTWAAVLVREAAYIEISGFRVTTTENPQEKRNVAGGLGAEKSHHIRFFNNEVFGCGGGGIGTQMSDYISIERNVVYENSFTSPYNTSGISLYEGRDFDDNPGPHNVIRANVCYRNENLGPTQFYGGKLTDGNGIIIDFARGNGQTLIENNLCFDNGGRGIHVFQSKNVVVRNNTLVANNRTPDSGPSDLRVNTASNVRFFNNIVVGRPGQVFEPNISATNVLYERNLFSGYQQVDEKTVGPNNLIGVEPQFVASGIDPKNSDFRLKAGSPARDAGDSKNAPEWDFGYRKRPQGKGVDIGAFEE